MSGTAEAGWYPDPSGSARQRYFDGEVWTEHYDDGAAAAAAAPQAAAGYGGGAAAAAGGYVAQGAAQPALDPIGYVKKMLMENYANFDGRARRAEYWWPALILGIGIVILAAIGFAIAPGLGLAIYAIGYLAILVPFLALGVRRLHDTGKSGWFLLISFIPFGSIVLLVFFATDGERGPNQYGPSPKY